MNVNKESIERALLFGSPCPVCGRFLHQMTLATVEQQAHVATAHAEYHTKTNNRS